MIEKDLREETEKWLAKAEISIKKIKPLDKKGEEMLTNAKAYLSDSKHFLSKNELIKAFEAVVWCWSIIELGKGLGFFKAQ